MKRTTEAHRQARETIRVSTERGARVLYRYAEETDPLSVRPLGDLVLGQTDTWDADDAANVGTTLVDLVADLLHFARVYGMEELLEGADGVVAAARRHVEAERMNALDGGQR